MRKTKNKSFFSFKTITDREVILLLSLMLVLGTGSIAFSASLTCPNQFIAGQSAMCTLDVIQG